MPQPGSPITCGGLRFANPPYAAMQPFYNYHLLFNIDFFIQHSTFDVGRSMFDVHFFKQTFNLDKLVKSRFLMAKKKVPNSRRANPE